MLRTLQEKAAFAQLKKVHYRTPSVRYGGVLVVSHRPNCAYPTDCMSTRTLVRPHPHIHPRVPTISAEHRKAPAAVAVTGLLATPCTHHIADPEFCPGGQIQRLTLNKSTLLV